MTTLPDENLELWRATLILAGSEMPDLLERFEEEALSTALFEIEDDRTGETTGWQVDLVYRERPDPAELEAELAATLEGGSNKLEKLEVVPVPAADWVKAVELRLPPLSVGRFVVHGSHARDDLPPGLVPVQIDAGLAFGSGEHATTSLCLAAIDRLARRRFRRVLDVGCGSGVLGIAAAKCWPAEIVAVDNDPIAVQVTAANAELNGVAGQVTALHAEGYAHSLVRRRRPYDLILANILADPLIELAPHLAAHLAPGGHAVLSGLLDRQADAVVAAHLAQRLRLVARHDQGPWTALVLRAPRDRRPKPAQPLESRVRSRLALATRASRARA